MKASFNKDGTLVIQAERSIECYALKHWWANYQQGNESSTLLLVPDYDDQQADKTIDPRT